MIRKYYIYLKKLKEKKKGQGLVEYGFIISFVAMAVIAGLMVLGPKVASVFSDFANRF